MSKRKKEMFADDLFQVEIAPVKRERIRPCRTIHKLPSTKPRRPALKPCEPTFQVFADPTGTGKSREAKTVAVSIKTPFYDGKENMDPNVMRAMWADTISTTTAPKAAASSSSHLRTEGTMLGESRVRRQPTAPKKMTSIPSPSAKASATTSTTSAKEGQFHGNENMATTTVYIDRARSMRARSMATMLQQVSRV